MEVIKLIKLNWSLIPVIVLFASVSVVSGFEITGDIINKDIEPGEHLSHEVIVSLSPSDKPLDFSIEVCGVGTSLEGTTTPISANKDDYPYSARSFLSNSPASFRLEPGDAQTFLLEGEVPDDIGSGTRYAILKILSVPASDSGETSATSVSGAVNLPIIIEIEGTDQIREGEISDLELEEPISAKEQSLSLIFENTGNTHFRALAKADLLDENGDVISSTTTPLSVAAILPGTSRLFQPNITPDEELEPGSYVIKVTVNLQDETILASKEIEFEI